MFGNWECSQCGRIKKKTDTFCGYCEKSVTSRHVAGTAEDENTKTEITKDSTLNVELENSSLLANTFFGFAWLTVVIGLIAGIGAGYSATHVSMNGQSYSVPNAFPHAIAPFLGVFGAACLGAAMLAFFGHVLILLNKIAEK